MIGYRILSNSLTTLSVGLCNQHTDNKLSAVLAETPNSIIGLIKIYFVYMLVDLLLVNHSLL
jgi:hypothetical protein